MPDKSLKMSKTLSPLRTANSIIIEDDTSSNLSVLQNKQRPIIKYKF